MGKVSALPPDYVLTGSETIYIVADGGSFQTTLAELRNDLVPVPPGGVTGQVLTKLSDTVNYSTGWMNPTGGGGTGEFSIPDASITNAKFVNMAGGTIKYRPAGGAGAPVDGDANAIRSLLQVEANSTGDQTPDEILDAMLARAQTDPVFAAKMGLMAMLAINAYAPTDPATHRALQGGAGFVWVQGVINTNQLLGGVIDGTTGVQALNTTNGTPTVAGIIAGSVGMIATADIMASVWSPQQATLTVGGSTDTLTFNAATGLEWTVASLTHSVSIAESCWTNIPRDKAAVLEIVHTTSRSIIFIDTSTNLKMDTASSPWSTANKRHRFELSWAVEGSAPTVKAFRRAVYLGQA